MRSIFTSTGTIRVRFEQEPTASNCTNGDDKDDSPSQWGTTLFFTPNSDSTGGCGGKQYALFFPIKEGKDQLRRSPLGDSGEGVQIKTNAGLPDLVAAAVKQTAVEVEVLENEGSEWTLHAITIPAPKPK